MLVLALTLIPLPVFASEAQPGTPAASATAAKTSQVSLKEGAARAAARTRLHSTAAARRDAQSQAGKDSPGFFKTKGGAVALAVMIAGVGYAIYSAKNDRITSPAKQ